MDGVIGILGALVILALKTGSVIAGTTISLRRTGVLSGGLGILLYMMIHISGEHLQGAAWLIDTYTFESAMVMAGLMIWLGWSGDLPEQQGGAKSHVLHWLPCPFCMLALAVLTSVFGVKVGDFGHLFSLLVSVGFAAGLWISVWGIRRVLQLGRLDPSRVLSPLLLFSGVLTLLLGLFIPNYTASAQMSFMPQRVEIGMLFPCLLGGIVLLAAGNWLERKRIGKVRD